MREGGSAPEKACILLLVKSKPNHGIAELFLSFMRLGLTAFGGPSMVAYIKEMAVNRKKWMDEATFGSGVALCQFIPGATAMQVAAFVGLRLRGVPGALASYIGFGLPAFVLMLALSFAYLRWQDVSYLASLFSGLQVIIVAIVAHATYVFGRSALKDLRGVLMVTLSAILFSIGIHPIAVIVMAALMGLIVVRPDGQPLSNPVSKAMSQGVVFQVMLLLLSIVVWFTMLYFTDPGLFRLAAIMFRIDLFAFGGGFASLPLMLHEVVSVNGWMERKTFMDGIALGQVTPGPIIITATFVGYLFMGLSGAIVATISIFAPSFVVLVCANAFIERIGKSGYYRKATRGIILSFIGLLLFVTWNFAVAVPWDAVRILIASVAFAALLWNIDILYVVFVGSIISVFVFEWIP